MSNVIWHGAQRLALRSRRQTWTSEGIIEFQLTYEGRMAELKAQRPTAGTFYSDGSGYIENVELTNTGEADKGVLTVCGSNRVTIKRDEVEWVRVDQDLRYHPIYQGGSKSLSQADREKIEKALRTQEPADIAALGSNATHLYLRLLRGETGYPIYIPVCRRTSFFITPPLATGCGHKELPGIGSLTAFAYPTASGNGKTYQYVKTADRNIRIGWLYERSEEWTGFEQVDDDIINAT